MASSTCSQTSSYINPFPYTAFIIQKIILFVACVYSLIVYIDQNERELDKKNSPCFVMKYSLNETITDHVDLLP